MIRRELATFLVVGGLTVMVDFLSYRGLVWMGLTSVHSAKGIGFVAGTAFAYFANRFWTFGHATHAQGTVLRFAALYSVTLAANVFVNSLMLSLLGDMAAAMQAAFLVATAISAALNFLGMKLFVFADVGRTEVS